MNASNSAAVKLASLYSGGKDSTFAIFRAKEMGHEVSCLITMHPMRDDSSLFHYPNSWITEYLSEALKIPLIGFAVEGSSKDDEMQALEKALMQAKSLYGIEGAVHGGISSNYQKQAFDDICARQEISPIAPLWNVDPQNYMNELVERHFSIIIVGVAAMGLDKSWLGKQINKDSLIRLSALSKKYGFNMTFEGGEAETLVLDSPIFRKRLQVNGAKTHWDGQRGIFEIRDVSLVEK